MYNYLCNVASDSLIILQSNQQVVYLQPGVGQMQGGVVMIAPGTTGAIMQPVQGQGNVQYIVQQPVQVRVKLTGVGVGGS